MPEYFNLSDVLYDDWDYPGGSRDRILASGFRAIDRHLNDLNGNLERLIEALSTRPASRPGWRP